MLARFFKPQWQHPKAEKRLRAISRLNQSDQANQEILSLLALKDPDDQVRHQAVEKLSNIETLIRISQHSKGSITAQNRLIHLLLDDSSLNREILDKALSAIIQPELLIHLIMHSSSAEIQRKAVDKLTDEISLAIVVRNCTNIETRIAAAKTIDCYETLLTLKRELKSRNKRLYRLIKNKVEQYKVEQQQKADTIALSHKLLNNLEQLARTEHHELYKASVNSLEQQWQDLPLAPDSEIQQRYLSALTHCRHTIELHLEQQRQQQKLLQAQQRQRQLKNELLALLTLQREQIEQNCPLTTNPQVEDKRRKQLLDSVTDEQLRNEVIHSVQNKTIESLVKFITQLQSCKDELSTLCEQLPHNSDDPQLIKRSQTLLAKYSNWPQPLKKTELICQLEQLLEKRKQQQIEEKGSAKQKNSALLSLLKQQAKFLSQGEIKQAENLQKQINRQKQQLNVLISDEVEQQLRDNTTQLQTLQQWKSFAITPKKEALCCQMEQLIDSNLQPQQRADVIKKLQQEWKQLDNSDPEHSQQLWLRFKKASDAAYAPCNHFFAEQRTLRQQNLLLRQKICHELEELLASGEYEGNYKSLKLQLKQLKRRWREASPVDRSPGKQLQNEFSKLITALEKPLNEYYSTNRKRKAELVTRSEQLLHSEDLMEATQQAKALQRDWKETGPAAPKYENRLWQQFRQNCSQIFDNAYGSKTEPQKAAPIYTSSNEADELFAQQLKLCTELESELLAESLFNQKALCDQWSKKITSVSNGAPVLESRFNSALQFSSYSQEQKEKLLQQQREELRKLCIRLEIALNKPTPDEDQALRMEYQLHRLPQALAEQQKDLSMQEIEQLKLEWFNTPFSDCFEELEQRFTTLLQQI